MAGVVGFEPTHGDTKNRCLTAWLHPNDLSIRKIHKPLSKRKSKNSFLWSILTLSALYS